jgi:hypothetical protein
MTQLAMTDRGPGGDERDWDWDWSFGRHAFREDAALTPIFHALARGGVDREPAADFPSVEPVAVEPVAAEPAAQVDPVDAFHRDPLTAPIPIQALVSVPSQPLRRPEPNPVPAPSGGRHHFRNEPAPTAG